MSARLATRDNTRLVDDFGLVGFETLDIADKTSVLALLRVW